MTRINGRIRGCADAETGESCRGYHFYGKCCHVEAAELCEAVRQMQMDAARVIGAAILPEMASDLHAHVDDALTAQQERARKLARMPLSDNRAFSLRK